MVETVAHRQFCDGGWKALDGLVEIGTKSELGKRRKVADCHIKLFAEGEMGEGKREVVCRLIEAISKDEMSERGGEVVDELSEFFAHGEVGKGGRKVVDGLIKEVTESEASESAWQTLNRLIESMSKR